MKKRESMLVSTTTPRSSRNCRASAASVMSGLAARAAINHSRSGFTFEGLWPPVPAQRRSPARSSRCSHLIADASLT
jgi:hypothetical protein